MLFITFYLWQELGAPNLINVALFWCFWDSVITFLIVALAAIFLVKRFLGGKGCSGCSGGCQADSKQGSSLLIKDIRSDNNKSDCSDCSCSKE